MRHIEKSALVPYDAGQMYDLVADIDAYPEFLPWVGAVRVLERSETEVRAGIEMVRGPLRRWFTTVNRMQPGRAMHLSLVEGPFRHLEGEWRFEPLAEAGSKVSLSLDFEFSSRILAMTVGPVFSEVSNELVDAFVQRAVAIYGRS